MKGRVRIVALILCLAIGLSVGVSAGAQPEEKVVSLALATSPWTAENPFMGIVSQTCFIHMMIWEPIFRVNAEGEVVPGVGERYEYNEDMSEYTVHLFQNAYWTDGVQVTADDIVYTFELNADPDLASTGHSGMTKIRGTDDKTGYRVEGEPFGVEKIDDFTVKFTLKYPMDEVTLWDGMIYRLVPKHAIEHIAVKDLEAYNFLENVPGCGPLIYESQIPGERMELRTNKDYHGGVCDFDRMIIKVVPPANLLAGFMTGELDVCFLGSSSALPLVDRDTAKDQKGFQVIEVPNFSFQYLTLDNTAEYFLDKNVRQAFCYAIDRQAIVDNVLQGLGGLLGGPLAPTHPYFDNDVEMLEYNPELAKQMLEEAGWDFDRVLKFGVPTGDLTRQNTGIVVQQYLEAVGVKTQIYSLDYPTLMAGLVAGDYDLGMMGSGGAINPGGHGPCYLPDGPLNFGRITDPRFADLYKKGDAALGFEAKKVYFDELQVLQNEECPYIYLYSSKHLALLSDRMQNVNYKDICFYLYDLVSWKVD